MKRLAIIPSDPIKAYLDAKYDEEYLVEYYNPRKTFDEVYLLSPLETDGRVLRGIAAVKTEGRELRKRIGQLNIDLVRAYGGYWACDMACRNKVDNVPVVVSVHDKRPERVFDSIKSADVVFAVSGIVRQMVLDKFRQPQRTWLLPNRVDLELMYPRAGEQTADLDRQYPYRYRILHVGRKKPEKNLDTLIKALALLGGDYCLIACGKGDKDVYAQLAVREGVAERCYFLESIHHNDLARYYSWAECVCVPSRYEGFGMVFIEALACSGVVVTSDIAPMNEYVRHMFNGLLVKDYENSGELARAIQIACSDEQVRERLKKNARESVRVFEKGKIDQLESDYYNKVLDMKRAGVFKASLSTCITREIRDRAKNLSYCLLNKGIG